MFGIRPSYILRNKARLVLLALVLGVFDVLSPGFGGGHRSLVVNAQAELAFLDDVGEGAGQDQMTAIVADVFGC